jgi:multisubunit Na+/H+ antiporter MnhB subunit
MEAMEGGKVVPTDKSSGSRLTSAGINLLSFLVCGVLIWTVLDLPLHSAGLSQVIRAHLDLSGVSSPVTAVLLNFRGYDTLLEVGVLLLASIGCLTLTERIPAGSLPPPVAPAGPVLDAMIHLLIPVMLLVGGYLLWAGEHAPGGAFQAGAVLGAAGVLLLLGNKMSPLDPSGWPLRMALAMGFGLFLMTAGGVTGSARSLLQYPLAWAGELIFLLETVVTLSIAVTLITLFAVNPPAESVMPAKPAARKDGAVEEGSQ